MCVTLNSINGVVSTVMHPSRTILFLYWEIFIYGVPCRHVIVYMPENHTEHVYDIRPEPSDMKIATINLGFASIWGKASLNLAGSLGQSSPTLYELQCTLHCFKMDSPCSYSQLAWFSIITANATPRSNRLPYLSITGCPSRNSYNLCASPDKSLINIHPSQMHLVTYAN